MSHELSLQYRLSHPFQSLRNQNEEQDIEKDETGVDINDEPPIPPHRRSTHKLMVRGLSADYLLRENDFFQLPRRSGVCRVCGEKVSLHIIQI